jgi:hypothetical protein
MGRLLDGWYLYRGSPAATSQCAADGAMGSLANPASICQFQAGTA